MTQTSILHRSCGVFHAGADFYGEFFRFRAQNDEPGLTTRIVHLGDVSKLWSESAQGHQPGARIALYGAGSGLNDEDCVLPALVEALERYSACAYTEGQFLVATADELGDEALNLDTIPRCSAAELAHSHCPLVAPDRKAPIRWVRALSILDGRVVYVPAVMVYLYAGWHSAKERIWLPISTGCAGHSSLERALLAAILEVIERDAVSVIWLQRIPLPRIELDFVPEPLVPYWDRYERSSRELEYFFFDATTDIGIPTIYGVQVARANNLLRTLVSCSSATNPVHALVKVVKDMSTARVAFRAQRSIPENRDDFREVFEGAAYMARAEHADAFHFLLQAKHKRLLSDIQVVETADPQETLKDIVELLREKQLDTYAIDLTTDEALRSGIRVVRVLIPGLQPVSFHYRARYLAHRRLYEAPRNMGYPVHREELLNDWPQPFS